MTPRTEIPADRWAAAEAEIGRMMAAGVPPHLRPKAPPAPPSGAAIPRGPAVADPRQAQAAWLYGQGTDVDTIARRLGVRGKTVRRFLRAAGVPAREGDFH